MNEQRTTMDITLKSVVRKVLTLVVVAASLHSAWAQAEYTVLPGDTFARIARAHDVTLTELREANPGRSEALSPGDIVRIPQPMQLTRVMGSVASGSALMHTVEAGQTLYSISKLHGISVEDLEAWNPSAAAGLSIGDQLVVGPGEEAVLAEATPTSLGAPEEILGELPRLRQDTLRTLLMLPFLLEADTVEGGGYSAKTNRLREISLEFFELKKTISSSTCNPALSAGESGVMFLI